MDAGELLKGMFAVYARARSYVDRGVVTTTFILKSGRRTNRRPFMTVFERPHRFRFEFTDEDMKSRLVLWLDRPPAKIVWTVRPEVEEMDLHMAIAAAAGISGGSAVTVPGMLMPELGEGFCGAAAIEEPLHTGEQEFEGVRCLVIEGHRGSSGHKLFVGAEDLLIRRIVETAHFGQQEHESARATLPDEMRGEFGEWSPDQAFDTESETVYEPKLDAVIDPGAFAPAFDDRRP
jgi:hypothetical protein